MRYLSALIFISLSFKGFGQSISLLQYKPQIDKELKAWKATFSNFHLSGFKADDTLKFENNFEQDFEGYKDFLSIYKPIITYSPDRSRFIDIYSYQLNLEKKGDHYEASPDIDQAIFLCQPKEKYWNRIYFGGSSHWIDEIIWVNNTTFILAGVMKNNYDKKMAVSLIGNTQTQKLVRYINPKSLQREKNYVSGKLGRVRIEP